MEKRHQKDERQDVLGEKFCGVSNSTWFVEGFWKRHISLPSLPWIFKTSGVRRQKKVGRKEYTESEWTRTLKLVGETPCSQVHCMCAKVLLICFFAYLMERLYSSTMEGLIAPIGGTKAYWKPYSPNAYNTTRNCTRTPTLPGSLQRTSHCDWFRELSLRSSNFHVSRTSKFCLSARSLLEAWSRSARGIQKAHCQLLVKHRLRSDPLCYLILKLDWTHHFRTFSWTCETISGIYSTMNHRTLFVLTVIFFGNTINSTSVIRQDALPSPEPTPFATALACRRTNATGDFVSRGLQTLLIRLDDLRQFSPFDVDRGEFNISCVNSGLLDSVMLSYANMLGQPGCAEITAADCSVRGGQNGRRERCRCLDTAPSCFSMPLINQILALCPPI